MSARQAWQELPHCDAAFKRVYAIVKMSELNTPYDPPVLMSQQPESCVDSKTNA
jgi:hypothetical protein